MFTEIHKSFVLNNFLSSYQQHLSILKDQNKFRGNIILRKK